MRICCDENIKAAITVLLEQEGYDVVRVQDELELGDADTTVIEFCRTENRLILTNDTDFFEFDNHPGILFLDEQRVPARDVVTAIQRLDRHVSDLSGQVWHVPNGWL